MSEKADLALARFGEQVAQIMGKPFAELLAVLAVEVPGLMQPDGTPHPQYLAGMEKAMLGGLRRALSAPSSGPVN
jgi:hypothetical protein